MVTYKVLSKKARPVTSCGDIIELMRFQNIYNLDNVYVLCKTNQIDYNRFDYDEAYFLIREGKYQTDKYPIIITKETAQSILNDPGKGVTLMSQRYSDRVR